MEYQTIFGYATVWDVPHENADGELQCFERSDCRHALRNPDCKALVQHDEREEIGRVGDGGLLLKADDHGLLVTISCPWDEQGAGVYRRVRHGELSQMSMREMSDPRRTEYRSGQWLNVRHIDELDEVTLTDCPRNRATAAIAVAGAKRYYPESFDTRGDRETLARLKGRGWTAPGDIGLAQSIGRRLSLWRLARIAYRNLKPSRPPEYLHCPPLTVDIDMASPERRYDIVARHRGVFA